MYLQIDQARLLTFQAAHTMDIAGNKVAKDLIAAVKIVVPSVAGEGGPIIAVKGLCTAGAKQQAGPPDPRYPPIAAEPSLLH